MLSSISSIRICDRSIQFLVNCFEKIVVAINDSGFKIQPTCLLVSEDRKEKRAWINRRRRFMWKVYAASETFLVIAEADRVFCHLLIFYLSFCTGSSKWNSAAINILLLFLAGLFIGLWLRNAPLDKKKSEIIVFKNKVLLVSLLHLAGLCEKS